MWTYYGSKASIVKFYPAPKYDKIIEPFAGTARYALRYFERDVLLVDKYDVIVKIWKWLQECSTNDIERLPHFLDPGKSLDDFTFDCDEAKWLMGFLIGFGMERPRLTAGVVRMRARPNHINYSLNRISANLHKIRHWKIIQGCYTEIENQDATWFIDPPYQHGGEYYKESDINYPALANWCRSRSGQVMVCENDKADWMEFEFLKSHKTATGIQRDMLWSNEPFDKQLHMF